VQEIHRLTNRVQMLKKETEEKRPETVKSLNHLISGFRGPQSHQSQQPNLNAETLRRVFHVNWSSDTINKRRLINLQTK